MGVASCVWTLIVSGNVELSIVMNVINSLSVYGESKGRFKPPVEILYTHQFLFRYCKSRNNSVLAVYTWYNDGW